MRFLAAPALALMALTTTAAHAQTALTPKTLAVLDVLSGGTISNTVNGGAVGVSSGRTASSTTILGCVFETIRAGAFGTSALTSVGGYQLIGAGGEATSTTVAG